MQSRKFAHLRKSFTRDELSVYQFREFCREKLKTNENFRFLRMFEAIALNNQNVTACGAHPALATAAACQASEVRATEGHCRFFYHTSTT